MKLLLTLAIAAVASQLLTACCCCIPDASAPFALPLVSVARPQAEAVAEHVVAQATQSGQQKF